MCVAQEPEEQGKTSIKYSGPLLFFNPAPLLAIPFPSLMKIPPVPFFNRHGDQLEHQEGNAVRASLPSPQVEKGNYRSCKSLQFKSGNGCPRGATNVHSLAFKEYESCEVSVPVVFHSFPGRSISAGHICSSREKQPCHGYSFVACDKSHPQTLHEFWKNHNQKQAWQTCRHK